MATHMIHSNVYSTMRMLVADSPEWVAGLGMGTSTARGARFPVPNRSYPAEREPARSSPIHPIARLRGSERLRRSTAKMLLALLYLRFDVIGVMCLTFGVTGDVTMVIAMRVAFAVTPDKIGGINVFRYRFAKQSNCIQTQAPHLGSVCIR